MLEATTHVSTDGGDFNKDDRRHEDERDAEFQNSQKIDAEER
jgi:hypothetical protein